MLRQDFHDFIFSTNTDGSGKTSSYVRALDMLGPILMRHYPYTVINGMMWQRFSLADIQAIHKWIVLEALSSSDRGDLKVVTPRVKKRKEEQECRTAQKAEVFTPSWVCNEQNNLVDEAWFGRVE